MVAPIAAAAGGLLVEKVADEESIVNKAFKLTLLIGLALSIGLGVFLIYTLTGIFNDLVDVLRPVATGNTFLGAVLNGFLSVTVFGRIIKRSF